MLFYTIYVIPIFSILAKFEKKNIKTLQKRTLLYCFRWFVMRTPKKLLKQQFPSLSQQFYANRKTEYISSLKTQYKCLYYIMRFYRYVCVYVRWSYEAELGCMFIWKCNHVFVGGCSLIHAVLVKFINIKRARAGGLWKLVYSFM